VLLTTLGVLAVLATTVAFWMQGQAGKIDIPVPQVQAVVFDPYSDPLLSGYKLYRDAFAAGDWVTLENLAMLRDDYVAYRSALTLTKQDFPPLQLLSSYRRLLELRIDDPRDKTDEPQLYLEYALVAEQAGSYDEATRAYQEALPLVQAAEGLKRLHTDPYKLANLFLQERQYENVLATLNGRVAPSLEAPAQLGTGNHEAALEAYDRWLAEVPDNPEALKGKAWALFNLGQNAEADAIFARLNTPNSLYGRGLIARRQGDIDAAVTFLKQTGDADDLWLAAGYLEAKERYADAIPVYIQLAQQPSILADDAAYRAFVLATRLGDAATAEQAKNLIPSQSFFGRKTGSPSSLPSQSELVTVSTTAVQTARLLAQVGDKEAATGELLFALRRSSDPAEKASIAEELEALGDYAYSWRTAEVLRMEGVVDRRLLQLAYPRAYTQIVQQEATKHGLDPALIWAIMRKESTFYPRAISTSNAKGLMQVVPSTWEWLAELQKETPGDPFDPATNIRYGAFYLRWLLDYLEGDEELVIVSYNRGQGYIKRLLESEFVAGNKDDLYREIDTLEAREYLQEVTLNYEIYKELYKN
jgi:soluble lytic murein transglycosylase